MVGTNKQGQALGRKGAESRARLLDAARLLIADTPADKLTVSAIARAGGLASQTFYRYFASVDELLLWMAREAATDAAEIVTELDRPWDMTALHEHAGRFVAAFYQYWDRNRAILNIRNFRADSGQQAFVSARNESMRPIIARLADRIRTTQGAGGLPERDALARAVIIVAAIERMASRYAALDDAPSGLNAEDLKRAEIAILQLMLSPTRP